MFGSFGYINTSSTKRLITRFLLFISTPGYDGSSLIIWAKGSIYMANKMGLRQHPCLVPLSRVNLLEREPLTFILTEGSL